MTKPSGRTPNEVFADLPEPKQADAFELLDLFEDVTKEEPVVWGPKIIGFGHYSYTYASGHSGEAARVGFAVAPRQTSLYLTCAAEEFSEFLDRLGPHKTGKGCIYITQLKKVDRDVLREMVVHAWANAPHDFNLKDDPAK